MTAALACVAIVSSCSDDDDNNNGGGDITLTAAPTSLTFYADATAAKTVTVTTNATGAIKAEANEDWITPTVNGKTVSVVVTANTTGEEREGEITISTPGAPNEKVTVTQSKDNAPISVTLTALPNPGEFTKEGGDVTFTVTTELENWDAAVEGDGFTLKSKDVATKKVVVSATANTATTVRTGKLTFTHEDLAKPYVVNLTQAANSGGGGDLAFNDYLGEYEFSVTFRDISPDGDNSWADTYADQMSAHETRENGMIFANAISELDLNDGNIPGFMDFLFENGSITSQAYYYDYLAGNPDQKGRYMMAFIGCILPDSGPGAGYISFFPEYTMTLEGGKLTFPKKFTHDEWGEFDAYYVIWAWENTEQGASAGRWSNYFMKDVVATKKSTRMSYTPSYGEKTFIEVKSNLPVNAEMVAPATMKLR